MSNVPQWVLAGDMATRAGLALGNTDAGLVASCTVNAGKARSLGRRISETSDIIRKFSHHHSCDDIALAVYEFPAMHAKNRNPAAQWAMVSAFLLGAHWLDCELVEGVWPSQLKKHATGKGNADKIAMCNAATQFAGRTILDHDEADAVMLLRWGLDRINQRMEA